MEAQCAAPGKKDIRPLAICKYCLLYTSIGVGIALAVKAGLPLAHHAQHRVVEDDRDDGQLVADGGAGFVQVHVCLLYTSRCV